MFKAMVKTSVMCMIARVNARVSMRYADESSTAAAVTRSNSQTALLTFEPVSAHETT